MRPERVITQLTERYVEEAGFLWTQRRVLLTAPDVDLGELFLHDQRIAAHLDGLETAGPSAWASCNAAFDDPSAGSMFVVAQHALVEHSIERLSSIFPIAEALPATRAGLAGAFGWVSERELRGLVVSLLDAREPFKRWCGVAACGMHRVDPGIVSKRFVEDPEPAVRARAFRVAGELGVAELLSTCRAAAAADEDPDVKFWAAWAAVLLGDRQTAVDLLIDNWRQGTPHRQRAFGLALQAMSPSAAHALLQTLATDANDRRWLIQGCGIVGDCAYLPWLVKQMNEVTLARLAGEAFAQITGADLDLEKLDRRPPAGMAFGPTDNPNDPNVAMDEDDGLVWPDENRVQEWWDRNAERFRRGSRHFAGAPLTRDHCLRVLKSGNQRQRSLAARYLCLLNPGTPLFNTSAPAWRQQRWLARLG